MLGMRKQCMQFQALSVLPMSLTYGLSEDAMSIRMALNLKNLSLGLNRPLAILPVIPIPSFPSLRWIPS